MEDDEPGMRLSKRFSENGEVDYKIKAGTAWSHSYLNQKPWHPLSYPNQRRKWIAEQTDAQHHRRAQEVAREFAQEQEFFRQTAAISKKEKEKVELMQAVSFMYVRPPGYNAESAKAAELVKKGKKLSKAMVIKSILEIRDLCSTISPFPFNYVLSSYLEKDSSLPCKDHAHEDKKKPRPKDVFGRTLPTEEEFEVLKNAPRLETGVPVRAKPFGVEIRNVKCVRCGTFGHQSGDRECPMRDAIMPNEESRLKRDDPLTVIMAQTDSSEPLKWELKQKPGVMSPPRGGFKPDDPNQQIIPEEIFDEYGGFLDGGSVPDLLANFLVAKSKKHSKKKRKSGNSSSHSRHCDYHHKTKSTPNSPSKAKRWKERKSKKSHTREKKHHRSYSRTSESSDSEKHSKRKKRMRQRSDSTSGSD
ncbi:hypothetical protein AMTR_s00011p00259480 [Amborella trichopoda]|uniref:CBF1-interacting co-repressor CIR N-terminal domain-containing protein n=1 Tax=Amborella trichopoda TaxID=13333 RepID=W1NH02_AMBTC|nr:hypothetical protein AMTR_s00011p00259480 [Amborella trichopoda]